MLVKAAAILWFIGIGNFILTEALNCPTDHYRCTCRTSNQANEREQSLSCSGVWALPFLNDTVPSASARWELVIENSNDIGTIPARAFAGIKREQVKIWKCRRLESVENHAFKDAKIDKLKIVGFGPNSIDRVESEAFSEMKAYSVNFGACSWQKKETILFCPTSLSIVNVKTFAITQTSFATIPSLQDLQISCSDLTVENGAFLKMKNMEQLRIKGAKNFRPTRQIFRGLVSLKVLHLSGLGITSLSADIFQEMVDLEVLKLDRNSLTEISAGIQHLQNLVILNLDRNDIDDEAWTKVKKPRWTHLEKFTAKNNKMTTIPNFLKILELVTEVELDGNTILCDCRLAWLQFWTPIERGEGKKIFQNLGATCNTGNWRVCSKVCPFNCDLQDCIQGLSEKECSEEFPKTPAPLDEDFVISKKRRRYEDDIVKSGGLFYLSILCHGLVIALLILFGF